MQVFDSGKVDIRQVWHGLSWDKTSFLYFEVNLFNPFIQAEMFELDKMMKLLLH